MIKNHRNLIFISTILCLLASNTEAMSTVRGDDAKITVKDNLPCFYSEKLINLKEVYSMEFSQKNSINSHSNMTGITDKSWQATARNSNINLGSSKELCIKYGDAKDLIPSEPNFFEKKANYKPPFHAETFKYNTPYYIEFSDQRSQNYQDVFWFKNNFCVMDRGDNKYELTKVEIIDGANNIYICTNEPLDYEAPKKQNAFGNKYFIALGSTIILASVFTLYSWQRNKKQN